MNTKDITEKLSELDNQENDTWEEVSDFYEWKKLCQEVANRENEKARFRYDKHSNCTVAEVSSGEIGYWCDGSGTIDISE